MASIGEIGAKARAAGRAVFGEVRWQRPQWLTLASARTQQGIASFGTAVRASPARSAAIAAGALAVIVGGYFLWQWYENRPKPVEVAYRVNPVAPTCYSCEPPGKPNALIVQFEASVAPLDRAGHKVQAGEAGISMSPQLPGEWTWDDDRLLRFQPAEDWPVGAKIAVKFDRKNFAAPQVRLAEYEFEFGTPAFDARIAATECSTQ